MVEQEQRTPQWYAKRLGRVTASRIVDMLATVKNGESASRKNYRAELVSERLTGRPAEGYTNAIIQRGADMEIEAFSAYAFYSGMPLEAVDFVPHPTIAMAGASPDRLVGTDGLVEMKCPNTATHIEYMLGGTIPKKYIDQISWQLACTGRAWCDFSSFDPRLPEEMRLFTKRIPRDPVKIVEITAEVVKFLAEVDATVASLVKLYRSADAA